MTDNDKPEDIVEANLAIKRGKERPAAGTTGKVMAGNRYEYALNPLGDDGKPRSETEEAMIRASGKDEPQDAERNTVVEGNHGSGGERKPHDRTPAGPDTVVEGNHRKG